MATITGTGIEDLVYEQPCSSLATADRAILIDRALRDLMEGREERNEERENDLDEAQADAERARSEAATLAATLEAIGVAYEAVSDARDDVAMVGVIAVPGVDLTKASEAFDRAMREAKQVLKQYNDGELE